MLTCWDHRWLQASIQTCLKCQCLHPRPEAAFPPQLWRSAAKVRAARSAGAKTVRPATSAASIVRSSWRRQNSATAARAGANRVRQRRHLVVNLLPGGKLCCAQSSSSKSTKVTKVQSSKRTSAQMIAAPASLCLVAEMIAANRKSAGVSQVAGSPRYSRIIAIPIAASLVHVPNSQRRLRLKSHGTPRLKQLS